MYILAKKTVGRIKALDGSLLRKDGVSSAELNVTTKFIGHIDRMIYEWKNASFQFLSIESQDAFWDFAQYLKQTDDMEYEDLETFLIYEACRRNPSIKGEPFEYALSFEHGWLRDFFDSYTLKKSNKGRPLDYELARKRRNLYGGIMLLYANHTGEEPTMSPASTFEKLMIAITEDPAVQLKVKDHKPHIREAMGHYKRCGYFEFLKARLGEK